MSAAVVPIRGDVRQLDQRAEPEEQITEEQAQDPSRLARMLMALLRDVSEIKRRWWPQTIDFESRDILDDGTTRYRFNHDFGTTRVRWWVVDWTSDDGGVDIVRDDASDARTLVLRSYCTGTITLRIEQAG